MDTKEEKTAALLELSRLIAALTNPSCHFDLVPEDELWLNVKRQELIDEFNLSQQSGSN
jgi:hypothetical protein